MMKKVYLSLLIIILFPTMAVSNTIFEKQLKNDMIVKFNYALENKEHSWVVELNVHNATHILEKFVYEQNSLPIRLTPDVWQETIYKMFSLLDAILLPNNNLLILYDQFGNIHCKEYKNDTYQLCNSYFIEKSKMSFLFGYDSGYGKMLHIGNMIYAYYSAAAPAIQNLIRFSLSNKKVEEIKFKDPEFLIPSQNETNKLAIEELLKQIIQDKFGGNKSFAYIGYINDIKVRNGLSFGTVYHFLYINNQLNVYRFDTNKKYWMIGNFVTNEIKDT